jgi:hypothetical protein
MTRHARRRAPVALAVAGLATFVVLTAACDDDDSGDDADTTQAGEAASPTGGGAGTESTTGASETTDPTDETGADDGGPTTVADTTGGSSAGGDYTSAIVVYLQSPTGGGLTAEQSACAAPTWLDVITAERLEESDQTPESIEGGVLDTVKIGLDEADAQELIRGLTDCGVDLRALFLAGVGDTPEAACIDEELSNETIEQLLREALRSSEPSEGLADEIARIREACGISD